MLDSLPRQDRRIESDTTAVSIRQTSVQMLLTGSRSSQSVFHAGRWVVDIQNMEEIEVWPVGVDGNLVGCSKGISLLNKIRVAPCLL